MSGKDLLHSYIKTTYKAWFPAGALDLRIAERSPEMDQMLKSFSVSSWAFITAQNPGSIRLAESENARRGRELWRQIEARGFNHFIAEGSADDGQWPPEEGLIVLGITRSEACELGQAFGQNAIVFGESGTSAELIVLAK